MTTTYWQGYRVDDFTSSSSWTTPSGIISADVLVIGGGAAGWLDPQGIYPKWGSHGIVNDTTINVSGTITITVGASVSGFEGGNGYYWIGYAGNPSSIGVLATAAGGAAYPGNDENGVGYTGTKWGVSLSNVGGGGYAWYSTGLAGRVLIRTNSVPLLTTEEITSYTEASCTANGTITYTCPLNITRRGFCYKEGTSGDPTIADSVVYTDSGSTFSTGSFSQTIPNLTQGTGYRVRAYAVNELGVGYGTTVQVTTTNAVDGSAGTTGWLNVPYFVPSTAEFRGAGVFNGKLYCVVGANVLAVTSTGISAALGTLTTNTGKVFLAYNGTQVLIVDGTIYGHYITVANDSLSNISDADFPAATSCCFMDGFFVITVAGSGKFYISGLYDVTTWDALDFATAEGDPDNTLRCFHANGNLWLFGQITAEVWYNSGNPDFPFVKVSGALIEDGIAGISAVTLIKDQFYYLSHKFEVLRTVGYQREKISTPHIDKEIQGYTVKSDVSAYEYRVDGHIFLVLTFPTEDKTWVYDITTDYWHEWQSYKTAGVATYGRHRGTMGFYFNGKYYVGDYATGYIYELSMTTYTDAGELIRRIRRSQIINKDRLRIAHHRVEVNVETGVGAGAGNNPILYLRWSDDNGNTWSNSYGVELGESGDYSARAIWRRLGMSRNRIYEVTYTEPAKFVLLGAYAELEQEGE